VIFKKQKKNKKEKKKKEMGGAEAKMAQPNMVCTPSCVSFMRDRVLGLIVNKEVRGSERWPIKCQLSLLLI
jgi:RPA family protein